MNHSIKLTVTAQVGNHTDSGFIQANVPSDLAEYVKNPFKKRSACALIATVTNAVHRLSKFSEEDMKITVDIRASSGETVVSRDMEFVVSHHLLINDFVSRHVSWRLLDSTIYIVIDEFLATLKADEIPF